MSTGTITVNTPYFVLMNENHPIGLEVLPLAAGIECSTIYAFSDKGPYGEFCTNSQQSLKPYPLVKRYLRNQIDAPDDRFRLIVIDAPGPGGSSHHAATMEAVLNAQVKRATHVTAAYRLMFDPAANAYRVDGATE